MRIHCPHCERYHDTATQLGGDGQPQQGDFGLCINCGEWFVYVAHGTRKPTQSEQVGIMLDPLARRARQAWVIVNEAKGVPS